MNPFKWVRWKVVIVLAVIVGALYLLGLNPLAKREINSLGQSGEKGARFSVQKVALGLLQGRSSFSLFKLATSRNVSSEEQEARERVASADEIVCDLGMDDLLRKRIAVDELGVTKPLLRIQRRADGTINIGEIGSTEEEKPAGKPTDWVKAIEEWLERIRKRVEERQKREREEKEKPEVTKEKGVKADYTRRITYPFEGIPRMLVRKLNAQALEIQFEDETGELNPPPIKNGKVEITNLSDRPEVVDEPIGISISGEIMNAPIQITGTIDLRKILQDGVEIEKNDIILNVKATGVPLQEVVAAFAGPSLDVTFNKGTADLNAAISLIDLEQLSIRALEAENSDQPPPPLLALHGVEMKAKPGTEIAGFDGEKFALAVNQAVNEVGDLPLDLEIGGTLTSPSVKWGDSIKDLVISGGKAFAKKQLDKGIEKGTEKAQELLDKELKDKAPDLKKTIQDVIPGTDKKSLKEGVGGALKGLFGPKKEAEEK